MLFLIFDATMIVKNQLYIGLCRLFLSQYFVEFRPLRRSSGCRYIYFMGFIIDDDAPWLPRFDIAAVVSIMAD